MFESLATVHKGACSEIQHCHCVIFHWTSSQHERALYNCDWQMWQ